MKLCLTLFIIYRYSFERKEMINFIVAIVIIALPCAIFLIGFYLGKCTCPPGLVILDDVKNWDN